MPACHGFLLRLCQTLLLFGMFSLAAATERIVLALPGPNVAPYLPIELIARTGADRQAGFELVLRYFGGGPLAAKDMIDGNSDFAGLGMPALAGLRASHPELVSIAALTEAPAYVLMSRQGARKLRSVADLRGRSIGAHSGSKRGKSTARQIAEYLLVRNGVRLDEVNFVHTGQNLADYGAALRSGLIDAIVVNEPAATLLEEGKLARRLVDLHDARTARVHLGGKFLYTQIASKQDTLAQQPDKARMLSAALRTSLDWIAKHSAQEIVARLNLPEDAATRALERFLATHKHIYSADGRFGAVALHNSEAFFHAISGGDPAARQLRFDDCIDSRWSGRGP